MEVNFFFRANAPIIFFSLLIFPPPILHIDLRLWLCRYLLLKPRVCNMQLMPCAEVHHILSILVPTSQSKRTYNIDVLNSSLHSHSHSHSSSKKNLISNVKHYNVAPRHVIDSGIRSCKCTIIPVFNAINFEEITSRERKIFTSISHVPVKLA